MEKRLEIIVKNHYFREECNHAIKDTGIQLVGNATVLTYDETMKLVNYAAAWLPIYCNSIQNFFRGILEMHLYWTTPNVDYSKEYRLNSKDCIKFID